MKKEKEERKIKRSESISGLSLCRTLKRASFLTFSSLFLYFFFFLLFLTFFSFCSFLLSSSNFRIALFSSSSSSSSSCPPSVPLSFSGQQIWQDRESQINDKHEKITFRLETFSRFFSWKRTNFKNFLEI